MENDFNKLVDTFKILVTDTMNAYVMSDIVIGEVISTSPYQIQVDPKIIIPESNLVFTKNTTDWTAEISVDHVTENRGGGGGYAEFASHNHDYVGRKKFLIHNSLQVGDKAILIQESGGQRYIVLDRWYNPNRGCTTK